MKRLLLVAGILALTLSTAFTAAPVKAQSATTITFVNAPANGVLNLAVGQSVTLIVQVNSAEQFISATALPDQYYPGRAVFYHGSSSVHQASSGTLQLTITGKESTSALPGGVAPVAIVVGVRYKGGVVVSQRFDFGVVVQ